MVNWNGPPIWKHLVCVGFGTIDPDDFDHVEALDMRPGRFDRGELACLRDVLAQSDIVVVGHNVVRVDLPAVSGLLVDHGIAPLPELWAIDTMNSLKTGYSYRNSLRSQCERYGVNLKTGSPDWDRVLKGFEDEWDKMIAYNENDVRSTLELEKALAKAHIPCRPQVWRPRKDRR